MGVVVILLMLLLIIGGVVSIGCFIIKKREKNQTRTQHLQDVVMESNITDKLNSSEITTRSIHYKSNLKSQSTPVVPPDRMTPAIIGNDMYSRLNHNESMQENGRPLINCQKTRQSRQETSHTYDDVASNELNEDDYTIIDDATKQKGSAKSQLKSEECTSSSITPDKKRNLYSLVQKEDAPPVPKKTPELYRHLNMESKVVKGESVEEEEYYTEVKDKSVDKGVTVNLTHTSTSNTGDEDQKEPAYYSIILEDTKEQLSEEVNERASSARKLSPVCQGLERNPNYQSTDEIQMIGGYYSEVEEKDSLKGAEHYIIDNENIKKNWDMSNPIYKNVNRNPYYQVTEEVLDDAEDTDGIYVNPNTIIDEEEEEDIYDIVHNEPNNPYMIANNVETLKEEKTKLSILEGMFEDSKEIYFAPIYSAPLQLENDPKLLQLKSDNIKKVKTLGTGFFGKVILANTVGLSPKDLKMSDTDDDKSKSLCVAVKLLKQNLSASRREEFDKELRFMSRLDHPNVIRTLGACNTDTPFVMMEYMENGDLNRYLQEFDSIVEGNNSPDNFKISTGTLTNMSAQIANAMKYLASRNFIHRDLATRNCLVGQDHQIKIADFGMSRNLYASHYYVLKGHTVLPVRWMAKECFYGKFSAKTDVWAFGVTMWEIFTLSKNIPYEDMNDTEVVANATKNTESRMLLEKPGGCPQEVYEVMLMCWAEEPKDRATFERLQDVLSLLIQK